MKMGIIFTAQAFDRGDLDPIEVDGIMLTEDDAAARERAMALLSEVSRNGRIVFEQDRVQVWATKSRFLIKVVPDELDKAGRESPILGSGLIVDVQPREGFVSRLQTFSTSIERSIPNHCVDSINFGVTKAGKRMPSNFPGWVFVGGLAVVFLVLVALLF